MAFMEREPQDELDEDGLDEGKEHNINEQTITNIIRQQQSSPPAPAPIPEQAVYGDTDLDPNLEDQEDSHRG